MTSAPSDRYCHWFANQKSVGCQVSALCESRPVGQRLSSSLQSAIHLFAKIVAALRRWLFVPGNSSELLSPQSILSHRLGRWPKKRTRLGRQILVVWTKRSWLNVFDYSSLEGPLFRNCVEDILTQLFGNSWNTRGRKASLVGSLGGNVAVAGFVFGAAKQSPDRRNQSYEHGYRLRRMG